jgi:hypothetical protein
MLVHELLRISSYVSVLTYQFLHQFISSYPDVAVWCAQVTNGIMGFSNHPSTLPYKLAAAGLVSSHCFSMCFSALGTGGALTIGPPAYRLNATGYRWAAMHNSGNWFAVSVQQIQIFTPVSGGGSGVEAAPAGPVGEVAGVRAAMAHGKGTIVDR